jgi:hypothetical protein
LIKGPFSTCTRFKKIEGGEYFGRVHVLAPAAVKRIFQHSKGCFNIKLEGGISDPIL